MTARDPSRRDVLRAALATPALAAVSSLGAGAGCEYDEYDDDSDDSSTDDQYGVILHEPDEAGVLVAAWSTLAASFALEVVDLATGERVFAGTAPVAATQQALTTITGLAPRTQYALTARANDGVMCGPHRFRTAPLANDLEPVRIAVGADLDPNPLYASDLFTHLVASDPDLLLTIGDVPYTDDGPIVAHSVDEYRNRHSLLRTYSPVRAVMEAMPWCAIYDDHEFANNWDAARAAAEPARWAAAVQVWDEFFPLRDPIGDVRYRNFRYGGLVEVFMLDCRRFRSADAAPDDAAKTMLGATQKAWFLAAIAASTATWKLVMTSVPLDFGLGNDHWAAFSTEREEILGVLHARDISGVVFISGDQHYFAAYTHSWGFREFQIGPLARGLGNIGPDAPGVLFRSVQYNFGLFDIAGDALTIRGVAADGTVFYEQTIAP